MNNKERIEYIDIAKGITILLVIVGHTINNPFLKQVIYTFHMPLFYILSGYFFKPKSSNKEVLKKGFKKLIIPYIISSLIITMFYTTKAIIKQDDAMQIMRGWIDSLLFGSGEIKGINYFTGNVINEIGAIWFLLSLFWVQILFNFLCKIKSEKKQIVIMIMTSIIGFILPKYIWLPLSIETSFVAIIFYFVGYQLKQKKIMEKKLNFTVKVLIGIIWILGACCCNTNIVSNTYNLWYINIVTGILGSYLVIEISKSIEKNKNFIKNFLQWCGKNSLYILCIHAIEGRGVIPWNKIINSKSIVVRIIERMSFPLITTWIMTKIKTSKN